MVFWSVGQYKMVTMHASAYKIAGKYILKIQIRHGITASLWPQIVRKKMVIIDADASK